ncbi:glycine--tRNA ligase subunit beta [Helicobacter salomonis]|uniref:glycine--tRNA ligase subunit beta n=1 Tax=Helicobacter salomonis TaxID=56878 RepID=UPI0018F84284|nr:glycine--tRNA ligase subunit beta [Helicobacter salomonis]
MSQALLIEILTEEMPAGPLLQELPRMLDKWYRILEKHDLSAVFELHYTPTRLVLHTPHFPTHTPSKTCEHFGPPLGIGTQEGVLNPIGEKFYTKLGLPPTLATALKNQKEVLYATTTTPPIPTITLLDSMVLDFLKALDFGKSMAWGSVQERFIRPIHNICVIFGTTPLELPACTRVYGCSAYAATKLHFTRGFDYITTPSIVRYFEVLQEGGMILDSNARRTKILQEIHALEQAHGVRVALDTHLLEEIVAITSYPTALYGQFDSTFLTLPPEVITTSMQAHQRYFAVFKDESLHNAFIVVSNVPLEHGDFSQIVAGNEKVLRARLSDAVFFYQNDLHKPLEWDYIAQNLETIAFVQGLGSLKEKVRREQHIGAWLATQYDSNMHATLQEVLALAKADLCSEVVYEFPELQATMGFYYAKHHQKHPEVCMAVKEQYLPLGEHTPLPSSLLSALGALAIKLDTLLALFSVGKIPTGSKDPFALRRAANGILRICLQYDLDFNLHTHLQTLAHPYATFNVDLLRDFILERFTHVLASQIPNFDTTLYKAVLKGLKTSHSNAYGICQIAHKVRALHTFFQEEHSQELVAIFKRVANITSDNTSSQVNPALFQDSSEHALHEAYLQVTRLEFEDFLDKLNALCTLKEPLELFFERVLVLDPCLQTRHNRQGLLNAIYHEFLGIADIKEL